MLSRVMLRQAALSARCTLALRAPMRGSSALLLRSLDDPRHQRHFCAAAASDTAEQKGAASPKVEALAEQIASLSLLEASELTDLLKTRLGISSSMMMGPGNMGGGAAPGAEAAGGAAAAPAETPAEKTHFTVKLEKFDASTKIKLIKEVRAYTGLGLKEAKELVESAPTEIKADVPKEDAEAVKAKLEGVGGTVALE